MCIVLLQLGEPLFCTSILLLIHVFVIKTLIVPIVFKRLIVISAAVLPKAYGRAARVEESLAFKASR